MTADLSLDGLLRWRCIGPFRGGRVVAVAGSYADPNTFYFGGCAGGVWKTTDAGTYWRNVSDGFFTTASVGALAVAPSDSNVIYAGTGETTIRIDVSHGDGVYKITDAGRTWAHVGLRDTRHIGKIRVHPHDPDIVWVAALGHAFGPNKERGVFKSTDGGETWRQVLFVSEKAGAVDLTLDETNPRILYAAIWEAYRSFWQICSGGPDSGLWQSVDGGETWENISDKPGLPKPIKGKIGVAASPAQSGRVWALIEHKTEGGLYRSDDHGADVGEGQRQPEPALARLVLHPPHRRPARRRHGLRQQPRLLEEHRRRQDLRRDRHAARRQPRPLDRPADNRRMIQGNDGGANVSLNGGDTFDDLQPADRAVLPPRHRQPRALLRLRHAAGQLQRRRAQPQPTTARSPGATASSPARGESGYIAVRPDDPDIVYVGAIGSSPGGGNCAAALRPQAGPDPADHHLARGDGRLRRQRAQVPLRLDLPDRDLAARPEHALHRRQPGLQDHRRGPELAADQPRSDPRRPRDAQADRRPGQPRRDRRRDLRDRLRLRRVAARAGRALGRLGRRPAPHLPKRRQETGPRSRPSCCPSGR